MALPEARFRDLTGRDQGKPYCTTFQRRTHVAVVVTVNSAVRGHALRGCGGHSW